MQVTVNVNEQSIENCSLEHESHAPFAEKESMLFGVFVVSPSCKKSAVTDLQEHILQHGCERLMILDQSQILVFNIFISKKDGIGIGIQSAVKPFCWSHGNSCQVVFSSALSLLAFKFASAKTSQPFYGSTHSQKIAFKEVG